MWRQLPDRAAYTSLCAAYPRAAETTGHQVDRFKTSCPVDWQEYLWCAFCRRADKKVKGGKNKSEDRWAKYNYLCRDGTGKMGSKKYRK